MKCSKKTKRLFSVLLALAMFFALLPSMTAFADESYDLWVGGVQVTSANAGNVLEGDAVNDGKVSYDADTKTLTLSGANIEAGHEIGGQSATVYTTDDLVLTGSGSMGGEGIYFGIYAEGEKSLTLNGDFSFTGVINGIYTFDGNELFIEGGDVTAAGGTKGIFASRNSSIIINGGNVTATGHGATNKYGYGVSGETLAVNGGSLMASGGTDGNPGYGIGMDPELSDALTVSGGSVTAVGNNDALFTAPTLGSDVTAVASANIDGTDHVSYDASQNDSYKWFRATETNTDLTIGGKSEWEFGDTIEFGSEEFYYIGNNEDRSVYHTNGDATLRYERWSSIYKQHLIYLYIFPTQYYIYIQPEDHEAETPKRLPV